MRMLNPSPNSFHVFRTRELAQVPNRLLIPLLKSQSLIQSACLVIVRSLQVRYHTPFISHVQDFAYQFCR